MKYIVDPEIELLFIWFMTRFPYEIDLSMKTKNVECLLDDAVSLAEVIKCFKLYPLISLRTLSLKRNLRLLDNCRSVLSVETLGRKWKLAESSFSPC